MITSRLITTPMGHRIAATVFWATNKKDALKDKQREQRQSSEQRPSMPCLFQKDLPRPRTVVILGATGVKQRYYSKFAAYLAHEQGLFNVVTFDYAGIGDSLLPLLPPRPAPTDTTQQQTRNDHSKKTEVSGAGGGSIFWEDIVVNSAESQKRSNTSSSHNNSMLLSMLAHVSCSTWAENDAGSVIRMIRADPLLSTFPTINLGASEKKDLVAVPDAAPELLVLAHSIGGQLAGMIPGLATSAAGVVFVACQLGYWRLWTDNWFPVARRATALSSEKSVAAVHGTSTSIPTEENDGYKAHHRHPRSPYYHHAVMVERRLQQQQQERNNNNATTSNHVAAEGEVTKTDEQKKGPPFAILDHHHFPHRRSVDRTLVRVSWTVIFPAVILATRALGWLYRAGGWAVISAARKLFGLSSSSSSLAQTHLPSFLYFPAKRLGVCENLPLGVASEWSRWGRSPHYLFDHVPNAPDRYAQVTCPVVFYSTVDDFYVPPNAGAAIVERYCGAASRTRRLYDLHGVYDDHHPEDLVEAGSDGENEFSSSGNEKKMNRKDSHAPVHIQRIRTVEKKKNMEEAQTTTTKQDNEAANVVNGDVMQKDEGEKIDTMGSQKGGGNNTSHSNKKKPFVIGHFGWFQESCKDAGIWAAIAADLQRCGGPACGRTCNKAGVTTREIGSGSKL